VEEPPSIPDEREVDRGVHNVIRTAMIAAMMRIAITGRWYFAMSLRSLGTPA
jgi:hypothetical protein